MKKMTETSDFLTMLGRKSFRKARYKNTYVKHFLKYLRRYQ